MPDTYDSEVVAPGDRASALGKAVCVRSFQNNPAIEVIDHNADGFRGLVTFRWRNHILEAMLRGEVSEVVQNDGAGGKPQFFTLVNEPEIFRGLGWEIVTMNADDIVRFGGFPAVLANDLNAQRVTENNFPLVEATMEGFGEALSAAHLVNVTGETAIMRHSITAFCDDGSPGQLVLTWGGTCIGLVHRDCRIDGRGIHSGLPIVGFHEPGYRCNGGTFFTNLLRTYAARFAVTEPGELREFWYRTAETRAFLEGLCTPSKSYARTVTRLIGWNDNGSLGKPLANVRGIAHITGGGVWKKLADLLPNGVGADLCDLPLPPPVLLHAQALAREAGMPISDRECYGTFHGACGMLIVAGSESDALNIVNEAERDGVTASIVGTTTASMSGEIVIKSQFRNQGAILSSLTPS